MGRFSRVVKKTPVTKPHEGRDVNLPPPSRVRPEDVTNSDLSLADFVAESRGGLAGAASSDERTVSTPHTSESEEQVAPFSRGKKSKVDPEKLKTRLRIHTMLLDDLDLSILDTLDEHELRKQIEQRVREIITMEKIKLNHDEIREFASGIVDEMTGLGPLEPLLADESISDILINTHEQVYVERGGELEITDVQFADEEHLLRIINKIVAAVGRRVDESHPMADARLMDGSRVNVAVAPIAVDGPLMSIRKFSKNPFTLDNLVEFGAMPDEVAQFLWAACKAKVTILISGGTGSGKTTLLNALSQAISFNERLITIEDAAELQLLQPHVARMETRPPNLEGTGEIRQRELVKNALRMRPDRVILGEVRGEEAFDMLQAMNTGHEGSLATLHANTPRDAITRLEQMVGMGDIKISPEGVAGQIASAIGLIIQAQRLSDGQRKITSVTEVTGMEGKIIQMQEIFNYTRTGTGPNHKVLGEFRSTGIRPRCFHEIVTRDLNVNESIFEPRVLPPGKISDKTVAELIP
jgi:pilus assembly protein CpaF